MSSLDLALVGNGRIGLLIDPLGAIVWGCVPRFDGDPVFCSLLNDAPPATARGRFAIELVGGVRSEQDYLTNTAVLVTRLFDDRGGTIEITDCVPRFPQHGRIFHPMTLVRRVRRLAGSPRMVVRLRPAGGYGTVEPQVTVGSSHIRYVGPSITLRLTTDASLTAVLEERPFFLDDEITLLLGSDETVPEAVADVGRRFIEETIVHWRDWVRRLAIPFEWQQPVLRAAITLRQNAFDDTGAIVAAMTTSIPESPRSGRNWDYRYCWLRDGYFVVDALNRLGATEMMEGYLGYVVNIAAGVGEGPLQPAYGIGGDAVPLERVIASLPGYRGMGPVRAGNDAGQQVQNDVYGSAVLAATHVFFDQRLVRQGDPALFERLEVLGRRAVETFERPDAGPWEFRGTTRVHTFSSVMCWAACDRLARIAARVGRPDRAEVWRAEAARIARFVEERCYSRERKSFVAAAGSDALDASALLLAGLGFVAPDDPRFVGTVAAIERELKRGDFIFRYVEEDDFGRPEHAFVVCSFWFVNALAEIGRRDEARVLFERLLACRTRHGLYAEHLDATTGEPWGNFVQTYSMVGLITAAIRLSLPWDQAF